MMKVTALLLGLMSAGCLALATEPASAQIRTWVSGLGSDSNACSRTAPCLTFNGALGKTTAGGEIDVLDPGGFGTLTINKAITIDGQGQLASVLYQGVTGITINAGPNDVVILRNLSFDGAGTGLVGIQFNSGAALHIQNCVIMNSASSSPGLQFSPTGASQLTVQDTVVMNNGGGGILIAPASGGSAKVSLFRATMNGNGHYGLRADGTTAGSGAISVAVSDSQIANNATNGVLGVSGSGGVTVVVNHSAIVYNDTNGLRSDQSLGSSVLVAVGGSTISGNVTAADSVAGGALVSYGNNEVAGNTNGSGTFTGVQALQ